MSVPRADDASDGELEHKKSVSCEEEPSLVDTVLPLDLADAGVVARDNAGFLAEPAGPRIPGAPRALPVGLASLSQQVSPGRLESSRVGLAFPTARRRGAGGFDAGLSGVFERACLVRRASSVASSGVKGGDGQGGRRGDRLDPIGHNYLVGAGVDDRVSADGCGRETDLSETCRAIFYRSSRAAAGQETTNPSSSPFPRPLLLYGMGRIRISHADSLFTGTRATNRSIGTLQRTARACFGRKISSEKISGSAPNPEGPSIFDGENWRLYLPLVERNAAF